jgi:hypothetical protein
MNDIVPVNIIQVTGDTGTDEADRLATSLLPRITDRKSSWTLYASVSSHVEYAVIYTK